MANQAQLDTAARQMGFKNYQQWSAWQAQQDAMRQQAAPVAAQPAAPAQPQQQPDNWFQNLIDNYTPLGGALRKVRSVL